MKKLDTKKWYLSKLVWVNTLTLVVGVVGYLAGSDIIAQYPAILAALVAVQGAVNVALRFVTWQPLIK